MAPIRRQEPGHFAFYRLSATEMIQQNVLDPWQLRLTRVLRRKSFSLVGAHTQTQRAAFGSIMHTLGFADTMDDFGRQLSIVERELLWAQHEGMKVPGYIMGALKDALEQFRVHGGDLLLGPRPATT